MQINNAGSNAYSYKPLSEASDEDLIEVVTTNTLGLMICCREAIQMMSNQPRGGHSFNIDGAGSDGRPTPRHASKVVEINEVSSQTVASKTKALAEKVLWSFRCFRPMELYLLLDACKCRIVLSIVIQINPIHSCG
ncbi:chlorophyll(ide) b reductase [Sarracenia purpurea var. burkii]